MDEQPWLSKGLDLARYNSGILEVTKVKPRIKIGLRHMVRIRDYGLRIFWDGVDFGRS